MLTFKTRKKLATRNKLVYYEELHIEIILGQTSHLYKQYLVHSII